MQDIDIRIVKARSSLITSQPFYGTLALHLICVEAPCIDTMATDGKYLFYAPTFLDKCSELELKGVVAHEVSHCAYRHHTRRGKRDADLWNQACDFAINRDLLQAGFVLPSSALYDRKYDGLGAEEIYRLLEDERQQQPQPPKPGNARNNNGGDGEEEQPGTAVGESGERETQVARASTVTDHGGCGAIIDAAPEHAPGKRGEVEAEWETRVRQALNVAAAQNAGSVPDHLKRLAEALNKPRCDWRSILRRFIDSAATRDYAWANPNRRMLAMGYTFPGFTKDNLNHLGVVIDTSGSISQRTLNLFASELAGALNEDVADKITVVYCDARVQGFDQYGRGDAIKLKMIGGGGTRFSPALRWFDQHEPDISALIFFTDLDCHDFGDEPMFPVLWAATGDPRTIKERMKKTPFGETIEIGE